MLINREKVGTKSWYSFSDGLKFDSKGNKTDVAWLGDCDDGVYCIAKELGFEVNIFLNKINYLFIHLTF